MYNVRIKRFYDSEVVTYYSTRMRSKGDYDVKVDLHTGEIIPIGAKYIENPFLPYRFDYVKEWHDVDEERSAYVSYNRTKHKVYDIVRSNKWDYFFTLTFNPDKVDSFDYAECVEKLSKWLNNSRRKAPDMKYMVVPELHKSGRFHFHGLFADCDGLGFVDSGHKDGEKIIYNVGSYKLGFSTATRIQDLHKSCSYITKYITKDLCSVTKGKKRYWASRNLTQPEIVEYYTTLKLEDVVECVPKCEYSKTVRGEFVDVSYFECPIYTTNTLRFIQNSVVDYKEE